MAEKKPDHDFIISDKRKFTAEGELRPDAEAGGEEARPEAARRTGPPPEAPAPNARGSQAQPARPPAAGPPPEAVPEPPSAAEQQAQHAAYKESGKQLDAMLGQAGARVPEDLEMNFERLVASLYMTAMMQLGMIYPEGEAPRADLVAARQSIDSLGILQEKTRGNLTEAEQRLLQNSLFELRMAFLEVTNAILRGGEPGAPPGRAPGPPGPSTASDPSAAAGLRKRR